MKPGARLHQRGFTLIEVVITVAIVGLLATVALPMAELEVQRVREQDLRASLRQIRGALDAYKLAVDQGHIIRVAGASGYPPNLQVLVDGVVDAANPDDKKMIYFLRRIPRDPMVSDAALADDETWGKRSYESEADAPEEGEDVFDVYPLTSATGINGIPYRNW